MGNSSEANGRTLNLPLSLEMGGREHGASMDRLVRVWDLRLPTLQKLCALHIANSGLSDSWEGREALADFAGCSVEEAAAVVTVLRAEGIFQ